MTHPHDNPVRAELQSLDQRRADTLADALRPVALTDDTPTPETWRVVEPDGSVDVLHVQSIGGGVYIIRCDSLGREHVRAASSRCAVDRFAGQYLGAAEIRGPGDATTAEQLAARDAALAAVDAVRADYAPRREPPTADEVRALAGLWGDGIDTQWVACFDADTHVATVVFVGFDFAGDVACRSFVGSRLDAGAFATWEARGPTGPVAWSELARLVEGVRRG